MLLAKYIHINMDKNKRPKLYTLPDTLQAVQHPPPSRSPCAACPAFGCVCRCVACCGRSGLHLARSALLPVLCSLSGCAGRCRKPPAGYTAAAQPRPVSLSTTEKIKKAQKITPPLSPISKIPPQKQKDLYKGSAFCAILALQALKGRNLQWLKIK